MSEHKQSIMAQLSPKVNFLLGFFTAVVLGFVIGFFVLLAMVDKNDLPGKGGNLAAAPSVPSAPAAPNQPTGPVQLVAVSEKDYIVGNEDAPVKIVEYSDIQCPYCSKVHPTLQQLVDAYKGKVAWIYRHYPLEQLHPQARSAANATECVAEQKGNKGFWTYINTLFQNQGSLGPETYERVAREVGADIKQFQECMGSGKYNEKISQQSLEAQAAGGQGTPYTIIVVGDQKVPVSGAYPFDFFKSTIDSLLANAE